MNQIEPHSIRFAAVGDLLLTSPSSTTVGRGVEALSSEILELFQSCDVVFANLECTLSGKENVPTEPRVLSTEQQVKKLKASGINIISLGNNHTFDSLDEGFLKLSKILDEIDIPWCGAGMNVEEAYRTPIMDVNGLKIAFLAIVDQSSGPYRFAGESSSGVAPLESEIICKKIIGLKQVVDYVIVSPHWGMERYRIPSLIQIEQAHAFVEAGASMVLGHHPHVLQGMEIFNGAPIAYSLGNFIANNVYWSNGDYLTWSKFERTGCVFFADLNSKGVFNVEQIPVIDDGIMVSIDKTGWGKRCIKKVNRFLEAGVTQKRYNREAFIVSTVKPILSHLKWSKLKQIGPKHFIKFFQLIYRGIAK
jgi:poly-gamma-glutamate synthesis protein (capsule biosynthesis protein)